MEPLLEQLLEEGLAALRKCIAAAATEAIDAALAARAGLLPECRACCERRAEEPANENEGDPMLTIEQVAAQLGVHPSTVDRYRASGQIQSYKFGTAVRLKCRDVDEFVERHREPRGPTSEPGA